MEDIDLQGLWKKSLVGVKIDSSQLLQELELNLQKFNRVIRNRDLRETVAALIIIPVFIAAAFFFEAMLSKVALLLIACYGAAVIVVLKRVKKHRPKNFDITVKQYLLQQRIYLLKEKRLLENIFYWYLLPPNIGFILFYLSLDLEIFRFVVGLAFVLLCNIFIYWLNKRSAKIDFEPLINELDKAIQNLNSPN